ncbi:MAG: hypothetical protein JWM87_1379 [Candidatus Eremiobacteraeota bacterium]|nr:hypothetical protein [Candidatus Eremiobacteraeota bacterium]
MSLKLDLPQPITAYFDATSRGDVDAKLATFDENARVTDERQDYAGRAAIRSWIEDTARRYRYTVELRDATTTGARTVVSAELTGDFPGSPVVLDFAFTLAGSKITRLEIG